MGARYRRDNIGRASVAGQWDQVKCSDLNPGLSGRYQHDQQAFLRWGAISTRCFVDVEAEAGEGVERRVGNSGSYRDLCG